MPLGREIHARLRGQASTSQRLVAVIGGREAGHDGFFSGPINFDTIEGILRPQTYEKPAPRASQPGDGRWRPPLRRSGDDDRIAVDEFWLYKDIVYRYIINSEAGMLAGCRVPGAMRRNIDKLRTRRGCSRGRDAAVPASCRGCGPC